MILKSNMAKLIVLTLVHFVVDYYGGLTVPLPEPTLTAHLGVSLSTVALLLGGFALIVNIVQPVSGWFLPRRGIPVFLLAAPLAAAMVAGLGLSHSVYVVAALLVVAAIGIGIVHPEAALAAHRVSGRNKGIGMSIFMAGGYFGFAAGNLSSGIWVEYGNQGLANFWMLALPGIVIAGLVVAAGLHRLKGHAADVETETETDLGFFPAWLLALMIAVGMSLFVRFLPIYMVRLFPDRNPQGWAGAAVFATGVTGALGSFLWGYLSGRIGRGRVILAAELLAVPFIWLLFSMKSPHMAPVLALGIGATMGGVFPLSVVIARESRGFSSRMRLGLAIGGTWGVGEILFIVGGYYIDLYPVGSVEPVQHMLGLCWVCILGAAGLGIWLITREKNRGVSK